MIDDFVIAVSTGLQMRWVKRICCPLMWNALYRHEATLPYSRNGIQLHLRIASDEQAILFCPWCGVKITVEEETK